MTNKCYKNCIEVIRKIFKVQSYPENLNKSIGICMLIVNFEKYKNVLYIIKEYYKYTFTIKMFKNIKQTH